MSSGGAPKAPRQYAESILAIPDRHARHAALKEVPEHLRGWVQKLVEDAFAKKKHRQKKGEIK